MTELTIKQLFDRRIYRKGEEKDKYYFLHPVTGEQVGPFDRWKDASDALTDADAPVIAARMALQSDAKMNEVKAVLRRHLGDHRLDTGDQVAADDYADIARDLMDILSPSSTAEVETPDEPEAGVTLEDLRVMTVEELRKLVGKYGGVVPAEHDRQALIELIIDLADWEVRP